MQNALRALVFDIDGTLAMLDKGTGAYAALPGAVNAVETAKSRGLAVMAYTNGTFFPPDHYYPLMAAAGLDFPQGHILTPATVAANALSAKGYKRIMVLGAEGTKKPLRETGVTVCEPEEGGAVDAVLLGWTPDFGAKDLEAAANVLWSGAPLYATSIAPYFAGAKGRMLGISGAIAAALQNATGAKATVFGKPEVAGLQMISEKLGMGPDSMAVIGDDPKLEIAMGRRAGAFAVGVTTGVVDRAGFLSAPSDLRANLVLDHLDQLFDQAEFQ